MRSPSNARCLYHPIYAFDWDDVVSLTPILGPVFSVQRWERYGFRLSKISAPCSSSWWVYSAQPVCPSTLLGGSSLRKVRRECSQSPGRSLTAKTLNAQTCWLRQDAVGRDRDIGTSLCWPIPYRPPPNWALGRPGDPPRRQCGGAVGGFLPPIGRARGTVASIIPALAVGATAFHNDISMRGFIFGATAFVGLSKTLTPPEFRMPVRAHLGGRFVDFANPTDERMLPGISGSNSLCCGIYADRRGEHPDEEWTPRPPLR